MSCLNPFPNKPWFLRVCSKSLLKTLWEKEKLLITSNFSFSHSVFYPLRELSIISSNLKLSSANSFNLEESKMLSFGKGLISFDQPPPLPGHLAPLWIWRKVIRKTSNQSLQINILLSNNDKRAMMALESLT